MKRSQDAGVVNHLLMCDDEGPLSAPGKKERLEAVDNHKKWLDVTKFLNCRTMRVNLHGEGTAEDRKNASVESYEPPGRICKTHEH